MPTAEKDQEKLARLSRCSPAYRAAVTGQQELPARKTRCGAVQFAAYGISERVEEGRTIIRATIDEAKVVELRLPEGVGVYFTSLTPKGRVAKTGQTPPRPGKLATPPQKGGEL